MLNFTQICDVTFAHSIFLTKCSLKQNYNYSISILTIFLLTSQTFVIVTDNKELHFLLLWFMFGSFWRCQCYSESCCAELLMRTALLRQITDLHNFSWKNGKYWDQSNILANIGMITAQLWYWESGGVDICWKQERGREPTCLEIGTKTCSAVPNSHPPLVPVSHQYSHVVIFYPTQAYW